MSRRAVARAALALGALGLCMAGFFACFERREIEIEVGVSAEARRNPYLALGRLLERMGHTVVALSNPERLNGLPPPPATLILPTSRASIGERRSQALLDWVESGGHLVVVTYSLWSEVDDESSARADPILDRFGLQQVLGTSPAPDEAPEAGETDATTPPPDETPSLEDLLSGKFRRAASEASLAIFPELAAPLAVGFAPDYQWRDTEGAAVWSVSGPSGVHLVELRHGQGRISALTSDEPLTNAAIGERDNAEFAVRWLRRDAFADRLVWIFYDEDWPSLFALARRHAVPAALAGAVLLAAWVWGAVFRFGPVLPDPLPVRRAWLEHLDAAGRFHWRQDRGRALLSEMRAEVARRLRDRGRGWGQLGEDERTLRIAERAGLSVAEVEHALRGTIGGARAFTASVSALERIRAAL